MTKIPINDAIDRVRECGLVVSSPAMRDWETPAQLRARVAPHLKTGAFWKRLHAHREFYPQQKGVRRVLMLRATPSLVERLKKPLQPGRKIT